MKMTFRWYGDSDPVTLEKIRQIPGVTGIVSAIYDIPVGEVWPYERIIELKNTIDNGYQSMLFMNRRGYNNFLICVMCGEVIECHRRGGDGPGEQHSDPDGHGSGEHAGGGSCPRPRCRL